MANEIRATYETGETLYALVFRADGQVWDQTNDAGAGSFESFNSAVIGQYDIVLTEIDDVTDDSGQYRGDFPPNIATGDHSVVLYLQAAGAPNAAADTRIGATGTMYWDGAHNFEITHNTIDIVIDNISNDTIELLSRLTGVRSVYLDELAAANIPADVDTLLARLTAARAGYLDELAAANIPANIDAILFDTDTTLPAEHAALPTANENRDAILDDATRFSGADIATILFDTGTTLPAEHAILANYVDSLETSAAIIQNYTDTVEATLALIKAQTDRITSAQITVVSPISSEGDITIVQGDDYLAADNTNLEITVDDWTSPDLGSPVVDATAKLRFIPKSDYDAGIQTAALEVTALITWAGSGNDAVFRIDLTAAQTTALSEPTPPHDKYSYVYQLQVTTAAGYKVTAALGSVYVKQEII